MKLLNKKWSSDNTTLKKYHEGNFSDATHVIIMSPNFQPCIYFKARSLSVLVRATLGLVKKRMDTNEHTTGSMDLHPKHNWTSWFDSPTCSIAVNNRQEMRWKSNGFSLSSSKLLISAIDSVNTRLHFSFTLANQDAPDANNQMNQSEHKTKACSWRSSKRGKVETWWFAATPDVMWQTVRLPFPYSQLP